MNRLYINEHSPFSCNRCLTFPGFINGPTLSSDTQYKNLLQGYSPRQRFADLLHMQVLLCRIGKRTGQPVMTQGSCILPEAPFV